eukprot:2687407-Pleurochrysis_carterae.AAC.1
MRSTRRCRSGSCGNLITAALPFSFEPVVCVCYNRLLVVLRSAAGKDSTHFAAETSQGQIASVSYVLLNMPTPPSTRAHACSEWYMSSTYSSTHCQAHQIGI